MDRGGGERKYIFGLNRNVFYTGFVSMLMDISSEMVYPLLPLFLTTVLGATKTAVGIIEGIAETTASILKIFSGWLSDKLGKRKLLMGAGYGISAVSRPLIAIATAWSHVLGARFIDRVGKGTRTAPRDAIIADSTEKEKLGLAFGFHRSMDTVGAIIGPGIAFLILLFFVGNLRLVFLLSTIPALISVLVIIIFITEKKRTREEAARLPRFSISDFDGPFRRYLVVVGIFSLGYFADAFVILRAEDLGVSSALIPIIYLAFNIVYALSSTPMGALADKIGLRRMVLAGFVYYSVIFVLIAFSTEALHIWILFPLYGIFKGMSEGTLRAYLATLAPPERKATAFGVYHTVVGLMLLPASVMAGYLWDNVGPEATFLYGSGMSALAALVFVVFRPGKG
ncbi:MAG: MFS transporter [Thermodesulfobacteriota bacterium]|nr:MAG: MFS transporter [Thermodesulfobacteriota bacterium]